MLVIKRHHWRQAALLCIAVLITYGLSACRSGKNHCPTCQHNGNCIHDTCECPSPYAGKNCQYHLCGICLNNGLCDSATGKCTCPSGYFGPACEYRNCPTCLNNGYCDTNSGSCICPSGYEGANCGTLSRNKFLGNWQVAEKGSATPAIQYAASITAATGVTGISIINFFNYFTAPVSATISGDSLFIPLQHLQGRLVTGKGFIFTNTTTGSFSSMSIYYEVIDSATGLLIDDFGYLPNSSSQASSWNK